MMVNHTKRQPKKRKEKNGFVHVVKVNWCGIVRYKRSFAKKFSIPLLLEKESVIDAPALAAEHTGKTDFQGFAC